jgi:putative hemolysin
MGMQCCASFRPVIKLLQFLSTMVMQRNGLVSRAMNLQHISYAEADDPFLKRRFIRGVEFLTGRPGFLRRYAATYLEWLDRVYGKSDRVWFDALERLGVEARLHGAAWPPKLPEGRPVILIANHPYGVLDGLAMFALAESLGREFRVIVNDALMKISEMQPFALPVDFAETMEAKRTNLRTRKEALERLRRGETIIVFPAGGISTARQPFGKAEDLPWGPFTGRLIHGSQATVIPVFFAGQNSPLFHFGSRIGLSYRLSLLAGEFFRRCGRPLDIHLGEPIPYEAMAPLRDRHELMEWLRAEVFSLPDRGPIQYQSQAA